MKLIRKNIKSTTWAIMIIYVSLVRVKSPDSIQDWLIPHFDKIAHLIIYTIFGLLLLSENKKGNNCFGRLVFAILFGILMEVLQNFLTTYRSLEVLDVIANTIGVLSAYLIFKKIKYIKVVK